MSALRDQWVSDIQINDEGMSMLVGGIARECHDFALSSGIPSESVEHQLPLVFGIIDGNVSDLLDFGVVIAPGTSSLATLSVRFSPEGYRRAAQAAKDRVANPIDADRRGVDV